MEKPSLPFSFSSLPLSFRSITSGGVNPDLMWRMLIGITLALSVVIGVFAYFSYQWALVSDTPVVPIKKDKETLSAEEIRAVINRYETKQRTYQELLTTKPKAPSLSRNSGVDASTVDVTIPRGAIEMGSSTIPSSPQSTP